jgi:hypothetical protein
MFPLSPSPGNPGEGWGGGRTPVFARNPLPNPPPDYRGRGKKTRRFENTIALKAQTIDSVSTHPAPCDKLIVDPQFSSE